ncbi:MAG: outer membrane lipoprotein carrier protein LolA [Proteobacteria bacterium]|nr:outer membrane lipoprotein carrier protein LolA [Pseudomonadota bacterium]
MIKPFLTVLGAARAALLACFLAALPGDLSAAALNAGDQADVRRIESYLNGITTLKSRFIQRSSTGHLASGVLYLSRPGRMRFEYDPPAQILLVADGLFLVYVDKELQQISNVPISATPLSVLVDANVKLANSHDVEKVERGAGTLSVTLGMKDDPEAGAVRLLFADGPIALKQWYIRDAQGVEVQVSLLDSERGMTFDSALFQVDPTMFENGGNQP